MGEHTSNIRPDNPWHDGNCIVETAAPTMRVSNVPLKTIPVDPAGAVVDYHVRKADYPNGLVVVPENNLPNDTTASMPVIFTESTEIILPLNGWPQGGGVIFL